MKLSRTLRRAGLTAAALAVTVAVAWAANLSFSTGAYFLPGYRLVDGTDLNVMVTAINNLDRGLIPGDPTLIGSAVNKLSVTSGATGVGPRITVGGTTSDTNIGVLMAGKGTGAAHLGGTTLANASLRVPTVASAVNQVQIEGAVTSGVPLVHVGGSGADTNIGIALYGNGTGATLVGGNTTTLAGLQVAQTASRVNDFLLTPAATSSNPTFLAGGAGSDAAVGATFGTAGTGNLAFDTGSTVQQFGVTHTASAVDYLSCTGVATGNPANVPCTATGSDTNVGIALVAKGSGNVKLGSTTVATCNGTTTATCQGQRVVVSVTGLSTAAGSESAAMTVTDANVVSSSAIVECQVNGYSGTGKPLIYNVVPGTGSFSFTVLNVATSGSLNATVPVACVVFGT
jgi:hypothetical protein